MSTHFDILTNARSVLAAGLSGLSSLAGQTWAVKIVERAHFDRDRDGADAKDLLVTLSPEDEEAEELSFDNEAWIGYPVRVTAFIPGRAGLSNFAAMQLLMDVRETVRLTLWKASLSGVTSVKNVVYEPGPLYETISDANLHSTSRQRFVFQCDAARQS